MPLNVVFENDYITIAVDLDKKYYMHRWKDLDFISGQDWKEIHKKMAEIIEKYDLKYALIDSSQKFYPAEPELWYWFSQEITPVLDKTLLKMAIVIPNEPDIIYAMKKLIENSSRSETDVQIFFNLQDAEKFLFG